MVNILYFWVSLCQRATAGKLFLRYKYTFWKAWSDVFYGDLSLRGVGCVEALSEETDIYKQVTAAQAI